MPLFMLRWPNGDLSFVQARSKDDACILLDEVGDANGCPMKQLTDDNQFMVHLKLADSGDLEMEGFGELMHDTVYEWAYPILGKEIGRDDIPPEAVEAERTRVEQKVRKPHPMLADVAAVAKRISIATSMNLADPAGDLKSNDAKSTRRHANPSSLTSPTAETT
jgi:hypothetical protein